MSLTIDLAAEDEKILEAQAALQNTTPENMAREILGDALKSRTQRAKNQGAMELLQHWIEEAETMSDEEKRQADEEWKATMRDLDEHRYSTRKLFPELARDNAPENGNGIL